MGIIVSWAKDEDIAGAARRVRRGSAGMLAEGFSDATYQQRKVC